MILSLAKWVEPAIPEKVSDKQYTGSELAVVLQFAEGVVQRCGLSEPTHRAMLSIARLAVLKYWYGRRVHIGVYACTKLCSALAIALAQSNWSVRLLMFGSLCFLRCQLCYKLSIIICSGLAFAALLTAMLTLLVLRYAVRMMIYNGDTPYERLVNSVVGFAIYCCRALHAARREKSKIPAGRAAPN